MGMSTKSGSSANSTISWKCASDHAGGEVLHGHVYEIGQLGKLHNLLEVRVDELLGVAEESAVEVDVLACGELEVKTRAKLDQGRDVAADDALSLAGFEHTGDDLEHGGLARTVGANQADDLAGFHLEGDVLECSELGEEQFVLHQLDEVLLEVIELLGRHVEDHGDVVDGFHLEGDVLECSELGEEQFVLHQLDEVLLEVIELLGRHVEDHGDVVDFDGVFRRCGLTHGGDPSVVRTGSAGRGRPCAVSAILLVDNLIGSTGESLLMCARLRCTE